MSNILFVGELPPPYGGVAVKDKLIYETVFRELGTEMIDLVECKRSPVKLPGIFLKIIQGMIQKKKIIIGVGTPERRKILLQMQDFFGGKKGLRNVHLLGMGGRMHEVDTQDAKMRKLMRQVGSIWLEADEMIAAMKKLDINNTHLFPNCRVDDYSLPPTNHGTEKLKLVYFSRICSEKGVDIIINAADYLPTSCTLDFYGEISKEYKEIFCNFLKYHHEITYHGVFDATSRNVYQELNQYDVMLLPSRWKGEGVPGALVESKMAGITAIVSDWNFNKEIVIDGIEGIVLKELQTDSLVQEIKRLNSNPDLLMDLKQGAYKSRYRYNIETYKYELQQMVLK